MTTKVQKWGNSLAVRLPKTISTRLALSEGQVVRFVEEHGALRIVPEPGQPKMYKLKDWSKAIIPTKKGGKENISENIDHILYGAPRR